MKNPIVEQIVSIGCIENDFRGNSFSAGSPANNSCWMLKEDVEQKPELRYQRKFPDNSRAWKNAAPFLCRKKAMRTNLREMAGGSTGLQRTMAKSV